ncbi:thiol oxidoreductase [Devosia pacifica]|uniref:Thiol oxidoreductase n=1 Tax=Devosia pacifica TaxID=1335967 RepID=A0A918RWQ4_9HYPH|nr:di-heme oxidoredictase family protein [Devosia pacifica]GHA12295.1 thiol oxidoreductase [Devosia pacifica]
MQKTTLLAGLATICIFAAAPWASDGYLRLDLSKSDRERVQQVTQPAGSFDAAEAFEAMQAGAATSTKPINANAFSNPSGNLSFEDQESFLLGNGLFRKDWATSPSSTLASDGLGPLFNARSCQSCHIKDGRGHAPLDADDPATTMLVRVSVPPDEEQQLAIAESLIPAAPHPSYGLQIQDFAAAGIPAEARVSVSYEDIEVSLAGGETVSLRKPTLTLSNPGYGAFGDDMMLSARVAPPMIGMGLLEAIHPSDILALADPEDSDGDGISGRPNWALNEHGDPVLGRFGWKAAQPDVAMQTAHAFSGDMGLSSPLTPSHWGDCTERQTECLELPHGAQEHLGDQEVPGELLELVSFYSRNLGVPARRDVEDEEVLRGKQIFYESGCTSCHTPKFVTSRDAGHEAQRFQLIWPYTDMLLHDMGEGLADNRSEGQANGREWRTPPLWGIGLTGTVNDEATFLHDGRARTILKAIVWHGGEAQAARDAVVALQPGDREALLTYLESL